jgi:D-alanyl-D-alanine carboxypeptidase/D-alanyl-D-alanine-endopeptidase (penicillin-binding protein 4)
MLVSAQLWGGSPVTYRRMRAFRIMLVLVVVGLLGTASASAPVRAHATSTPQTPLAKLKQALRTGMKQAGHSSGAYVVDLNTGAGLFSAAATTPRLPASVEKLYTTSTALLRFGPQATLVTGIYGVGSMSPTGTWNGTLYIRGGGDPTFGSVSFDSYAYGAGATMQRLVHNLIGATGIQAVHGAIVGDESFFDSRRGTPATGYAASSEVEGLLSALIFDRGLANEQGTALQRRPALFTTTAFAAALRSAQVNVPKSTRVYTGRMPPTAQRLAMVHSPRMATLIKLTNTPSDNFFAEMLIKDIGARFANAGTTAAGASVVRAQIAKSFGIHPTLVDGSGLSYSDYTSPVQVVTLLSKMATNADFVGSLAVAGQTGTLADEMKGTVAAGRCRGKTGTLIAASNLVGYCTAKDGHTLAFALMMNAIDPNYAHPIQNRMVEAIARYSG